MLLIMDRMRISITNLGRFVMQQALSMYSWPAPSLLPPLVLSGISDLKSSDGLPFSVFQHCHQRLRSICAPFVGLSLLFVVLSVIRPVTGPSGIPRRL
jgi:hypothetical protein